MGGEGSIMAMILSLKQNRAMLRRRGFLNEDTKKRSVTFKAGKNTLIEKNIPGVQLVKIKTRIKDRISRENRLEIILLIISGIIGFAFLIVIFKKL